MKWKILNQKHFVVCCLLSVVILGAFFRFYNLNWDEGHFFHPDERNIALAVSKIAFPDQLNPEFFAYGSLPIYFYRAIGESLVFLTKNRDWVTEWPKINLIGRGVSAFFATLSIPLIFLLGKKIWNEKVGLLAAFLAAFTVCFIQTAHYAVTESLLVFWLLILALVSLELAEKPTLKIYTQAGLILGLAIATKVSALSFAILPISAHFLYHFREIKTQSKLILLFLIAFLTFAVFSPYVFLDYTKFKESMDYETAVATGTRKVVYVLQFEKTIPYLFQIKNLFWQLGFLALGGFLGIAILFFLAIKNKDKRLLLFLSFPLIYFAYVGQWHTKFIRYMLPILPFLILSASWFLYWLREKSKALGTLLIILTLPFTLVWSLAFFSIYTRESTRITASKWIYQNIPQGSKILTEHWDDGLPLSLIRNHPSQYAIEQLTVYEPDNQLKLVYYAQKLSQSDYLVINSRRLYGTLINLPEKYPLTSRYYQLLFTEKLGYAKVAEFTSYPSFLGIAINDDASEETFQVYDHPKVIIFKKITNLTQRQLENILKQ